MVVLGRQLRFDVGEKGTMQTRELPERKTTRTHVRRCVGKTLAEIAPL